MTELKINSNYSLNPLNSVNSVNSVNSMQHIIQEIVDIMQDFVCDEEKRIMLIEDRIEEAPVLLKGFSIVEEDEQSSDVFLSFGDEFQDPRRFAELVIERQQEQIEQLNVELEKINKSPLPNVPSELLERDKPSQIRLFRLFRHIRETVEAERRVVWVFHPLKDTTREEQYADLFGFLIEKIIKGEAGDTKLIVRDTPANLLKEKFGCDNEEKENEQIFCYKPKLDFQSVMEKVEAQAKNKDAPVEERMQSLMLTAGVDVAEKRFDRALEKNERVLSYYEKTKQKQHQSVVQNNIGDIYYLQEKYPEAQQKYEKAVTIAVEEKSQPLVLYQSINLGNALFMQQKYDEAYIYYDSAEKLADVNKVLIKQVQALESMGDTKRAQGEIEEAIEIYEKAAQICRDNKYTLGLTSVLERLCAVYEETGDDKKHRECNEELETAKNDLREINANLVEDEE